MNDCKVHPINKFKKYLNICNAFNTHKEAHDHDVHSTIFQFLDMNVGWIINIWRRRKFHYEQIIREIDKDTVEIRFPNNCRTKAINCINTLLFTRFDPDEKTGALPYFKEEWVISSVNEDSPAERTKEIVYHGTKDTDVWWYSNKWTKFSFKKE
jgi:hypothetical protein